MCSQEKRILPFLGRYKGLQHVSFFHWIMTVNPWYLKTLKWVTYNIVLHLIIHFLCVKYVVDDMPFLYPTTTAISNLYITDGWDYPIPMSCYCMDMIIGCMVCLWWVATKFCLEEDSYKVINLSLKITCPKVKLMEVNPLYRELWCGTRSSCWADSLTAAKWQHQNSDLVGWTHLVASTSALRTSSPHPWIQIQGRKEALFYVA